MPTMAMGSCGSVSAAGRSGRAGVSSRPRTAARRWAASSRGVGWSKVTVVGRRSPGVLGQPVAQGDDGDRGQAEVAEGAVGREGGRVGAVQDAGGLLADQLFQEGQLGSCVEAGQVRAQGGGDGSVGARPARPAAR